MRIKLVLMITTLVLLFIVVGCTKSGPVCGNKVCELKEDCNNCIKDCSCKSSESCQENGVCLSEVCGDDVCSVSEKSSLSCCQDCGCSNDLICNKANQQCQEKSQIDDDKIQQIAQDYLSNNKLSGKIVGIQDTYYKEQTVKQVTIDCRTITYPMICKIILFIDNNGKVVEETRTT